MNECFYLYEAEIRRQKSAVPGESPINPVEADSSSAKEQLQR